MTDTHSFSYKTGLFAVRYRWWIVLVNFLLVNATIVGFMMRGKTFGEHVDYMKHVRNNPLDKDSSHVSPPPIFNSDYHVFFEKDNEDLVEFEAFQGTFSKEDNLVIVVRSRSGELFTPENLATLFSKLAHWLKLKDFGLTSLTINLSLTKKSNRSKLW